MAQTDHFARWLIQLDDESFFALMRNYLGPIRTPYNKHDLIRELTALLHRETMVQQIRRNLSTEDIYVLQAISLLAEPQEGELTQFLQGTLSGIGLQQKLINLRDRLLIIPAEHRAGGVCINPVVAPWLLEDVGRSRTLLAGEPRSTMNTPLKSPLPWFSNRCLAALIALFQEEPEFFTRAGGVRKRAEKRRDECFGHLFQGTEGTERFALAVRALETLELLTRADDGRISVRRDSVEQLTEIPERWVQALLWGAATTDSLNNAVMRGEMIAQLVTELPQDRVWSAGEMIRLMMLSQPHGAPAPAEATVSALAALDVLTRYQDTYVVNPAAEAELNRSEHDTAIHVSATMTISVPPGCSTRTVCTVARIAQLQQFDVVTTFLLSEEYLLKLPRDDRHSALEDLTRLSGELPQNVEFLMNRWQTRGDAVRLLQGLILTVTEEHRSLLEQDEEFIRVLREIIAPGVYLVSPQSRSVVQRIIQRRGIGTVTALEEATPIDENAPDFLRLVRLRQQPMLIGGTKALRELLPPEELPESDPPAAPDQWDPEQLYNHLTSLKMPEDIEWELALRIERKLILFPEQLRQEVVPPGGIEARGLDYLGKVRLAEQAISAGEMLEIILRNPAGQPERIRVIPKELVKHQDDLFLRALQLPDEAAVRIRLRRVSLLRRLRGTLVRGTC